MLLELTIKNFAIIEKQIINFENGLTVLTGETGAGKSIIIDAIGILVGGRSSTEFIRHGSDKAELEGFFSFNSTSHPAILKARELDIDVEEETLVFRREISINGKSTCKINGKMVTLATLKEIGRKVIDIHGQHEHQELMDSELHLTLLDKFGIDKIKPFFDAYQMAFNQYTKTVLELRKLNQNDQQLAQRLDLIQFQFDEISKANVNSGEDELLLEEKSKLNNFEKIFSKMQGAYNALSGESSGLEAIGLARRELESIEGYSEEYKKISETISNAYYALEDVSYSIHSELENFEFDAERLEEVENRLDEINHLKRKYGQSIEEILTYRNKIETEIDEIKNKESRLDQLNSQLSQENEVLHKHATELTEVRKQCAQTLEKLIHQELQDLYMEKAKFQVHFEKIAPNKNGFDEIEFYITTNPGEPLKPLSKTASGGELSRIMLAIKNIFTKLQGITTIIFDEIDSGVSGRVAQAIAEKMFSISMESQVLCISHLPHVAAMADSQMFISKVQEEETTRTSVTILNEKGRIQEIAKMISGNNITAHTNDHIREMLEQARLFKETNKK
ncbi:MAG: recN [Bacillales bacterium]|jgi:DNA repair protein RecN (Recombination protein N)|nr:recN [Bacillales bacterium]